MKAISQLNQETQDIQSRGTTDQISDSTLPLMTNRGENSRKSNQEEKKNDLQQ